MHHEKNRGGGRFLQEIRGKVRKLLMWWLSVSVIFEKQSCIRYSKRRKFRPKMRQNAFGGRAPPGPAGGA